MSTLPKAVNNPEKTVTKVPPRDNVTTRPPVVKPAFDPLDPQWQSSARARPVEPETPNEATPNGATPTVQTPAMPVRQPDAEELQRMEKAGPYVTAARLAFERGNVPEARARLQEALTINPTDSAALELCGDIFMAEAEQEKAIAVYERGKKYHPQHRFFEEKIAVALLDIEEEKRDAALRQQVLETGDRDRWQDRKSGIALTLSLLLPGAGQFYNDENERGGILLGIAFLTFLGWALTLNAALSALPAGEGARRLVEGIGMALNGMGGLAKGFFWLSLLGWLGVTAFAAWDGFVGAERHNTARRRSLGI
jgi:tetratricopeptide (TPR) repeat protein